MINFIKDLFILLFYPLHILVKIGLWLAGWRNVGKFNKNKPAIIISAPHTSNWDAIWGVLWSFAYIWPKKVVLGYKKEAAIFPLGGLFKILGGVAIDRTKNQSVMSVFISKLKSGERSFAILTPEGTRSNTDKWNKGFYLIARRVNLPILCWKIDYKHKKIYIPSLFYTTGNFDTDMAKINDYYKDSNPKHPSKFSLHKI